ncbi:MAG: SAM-dependent methyltransferase, partial [Planctomycetota bacterium]
MDTNKKYMPYYGCFLCIIIVCLAMGGTSPAAFASERDKVFWDKKYGTEAYIFGKEPVAFLRE